MHAVDFTCTIQEGGKLPKGRARFLRTILAGLVGYEVRFRLSDPLRTGAQNRFYWGFRIRPISDAMIRAGIMVRLHQPDGRAVEALASDEYVHHLFKCRYLGLVVMELGGDQHTMVRSSTDLTVEEFSDYVSAIETDPMVESLGVYLPTPGEAGFDKPFRSGKIYEMAA